MDAVKLNEALVEEFKRIGSREPIDRILRDTFGVVSVTALPASQAQALIDAVKLVPSKQVA